MLSLSALFSLALLPAVSLAAPVTPEQPGPIVLEGRGPATAGVPLDALRRRDVGNFDKYAGIRAEQLQQGHEHLEKRAVAPGWSEVKLTNQFNSATGAFQTHAGTIQMGIPAQSISVLFDTGSTDLVSPVTCQDGCPNGYYNIDGVTRHYRDRSNGTTIAVSYGGGATAYGYEAEDQVRVGKFQVLGQRFVAATSHKSTVPENYAGVMGLAPGPSKLHGLGSFMNRIFTTRMWEGLWADRSEGRFFTMWFSRDTETKSQLVIGGADTDKFEGELINVPVPQGLPYWGLITLGYSVGDEPVASSGAITLIDSGTSNNFIPRAAAAALYAKIGGKLYSTDKVPTMGNLQDVDVYTVPCSQELPVGFSFAGAKDTVYMKPQDSVLDRDGDLCFGAFSGVDIDIQGAPASLLGLPFLRSLFSVFSYGDDGQTYSISFAPAKN
ncbi:pepsin-like aspartic protease [Rhodotorula paludigena]|uniref:pepsin-like aspartic protease n=1 Tax=Rhodotorula paludigena TaxID=86838 RepID=UPI00317804B5